MCLPVCILVLVSSTFFPHMPSVLSFFAFLSLFEKFLTCDVFMNRITLVLFSRDLFLLFLLHIFVGYYFCLVVICDCLLSSVYFSLIENIFFQEAECQILLLYKWLLAILVLATLKTVALWYS